MEGAFRCDVNRGILEADKDFVNKNEQLVNVFFTARLGNLRFLFYFGNYYLI